MLLGIRKIDFPSSDDIRKPDKTVVETITVGATKVARLTVQPGWVWSECIAPVIRYRKLSGTSSRCSPIWSIESHA